MGGVAHSRGALVAAVVGHVLGALLLIKLMDTHRVMVQPPIVVEIIEPEVKEEPPPPPKKKEKLPEPKVEEPPPPEILPEPLPQEEPPPPVPVVQPVQRVRQEPLPDVVRPQPVQPPAPVPTVRRPVEPVVEPIRPVAPPAPMRETPQPILTTTAPSPVQVAPQPAPVPTQTERPLQAPVAPRVAPREPPRRALPDAPVVMEVAEAPLPPGEEMDMREPPPLPIGPAPEAPEISLDAQTLAALYLRNPKPGYPAASRRLGEQGTVQIRVFVTVAGEAKRVELKASSGFPRLDRAALDSVERWRFVPAKREDKPVDAWVVVPIKFTLNK